MYYIKVKTEFEGFHKYVGAPEEVKFLRNYHRHIFKVEAEIRTTHADRQVEFFIIKGKLNEYISFTYKGQEFNESCETIAENIYHFLKGEGLECLQVEVSEDGENAGGYIYG